MINPVSYIPLEAGMFSFQKEPIQISYLYDIYMIYRSLGIDFISFTKY